MEQFPLVSVIVPIRNSAWMLDDSLRSICNQRYPRQRIELIVPDGQSSDNGAAIARSHGGIVLENGGLKIGHARDIGFSLAHGELIAFTDADCIVDAGWLANAIPYFADPKVGAVGGPSPVPGGQGPIAEAIGYFFRAATGVAGAAHVEEQFGVEEVRHLPGCNLVCRHEALQQIFPLQWEETSGEDLQLGRLLLQRGWKLLRVPDVRVLHYKRTTLRAFYWQMRSYGRGRMHLALQDNTWLHPAHIACGVALPLAALMLAVAALVSPLAAIALVAFGALSTALFGWWAVAHGASTAVLWSGPVVLCVGIAGWSHGFLEEYVEHLRTRP